ncbi:MAG: aspartate-semialdehyde dehydrogenase [Thermoproteota archaeon]
MVKLDKLEVTVLGASGMAGQEYLKLLSKHPFFEVKHITGKSSVGKKLKEVVKFDEGKIDESLLEMTIEKTDVESMKSDLFFSALPTNEALYIEQELAKRGFKVISDASAYRMESDVPLVIPEVNSDHLALIEVQKRRRGWSGFIVTTPNCTTVGLAIVLKPIYDHFGIEEVVVTTMQALSGAGYPGVPSLDIIANVIPYIENEEEKVSNEALKILGTLEKDSIKPANISINVSCNRVSTVNGHLESVFLKTRKSFSIEEVKNVLASFKGKPQLLKLPSAPENVIILDERKDRPQPRLDCMAGSVAGMSVVVGRLRKANSQNSLMLTLLSNNVVRGAGGGAVLTAELMFAENML